MTITATRTTVNTAPLTATEERRKHKLSSTHTISYTCRTLLHFDCFNIFWSTQLHVCSYWPKCILHSGWLCIKSCVLSDFLKHDQNVVYWLLVTHRKFQTMFTNKKTWNSKSVWEASTLRRHISQSLCCLVLLHTSWGLPWLHHHGKSAWNVAKQVLRKTELKKLFCGPWRNIINLEALTLYWILIMSHTGAFWPH